MLTSYSQLNEQRPHIRVKYTDMYEGFPDRPNGTKVEIAGECDWVIDRENPDVIIYSVFGYDHLRYEDKIRVFLCGENSSPDFSVCDYALSFFRDRVGGRNVHMLMLPPHPSLRESKDDQVLKQRPFASFVASQCGMGHGAILRRDFVEFLSSHYKSVDCPGIVLHNIDIPGFGFRGTGKQESVSKVDVLSRYKFNIAFENSNTDGYITEKLIDAYLAFTVPIYWGSEGNIAPFSKDSMICANDYDSFEDLAARIRQVDEDDDLYMSMLRANPILTGEYEKIYHAQREQEELLWRRVEQAVLHSKSLLQLRERPLFGSFDAKLSRSRKEGLKQLCPAWNQTFPSRLHNTLHLYSFLPKKITRRCPLSDLMSDH